MESATSVSSLELFNLLQARKNWPSGGPPVLFDVRSDTEYGTRHAKGAFRVSLKADGELDVPEKTWMDRSVCVYDSSAEQLEDHAVVQALLKDGKAKAVLVLSEPYASFEEAFPFLCAKGSSSKAMKRPPPYPSSIIPGLLYLGDLEDAASLPRLRQDLNIQYAITALADPPASLKESVAEARVAHTWCNVRDVEGADIKEHFELAFKVIEKAREAKKAVFVHCSRGVSRSASLVIAYLMKKDGHSAQAARDLATGRRPIVLPNEGFWRCLLEFEKEISGSRTGVYVPIKTQRVEDMEIELPPEWAAPPSRREVRLRVERNGELVEELDIGEHPMYTFGRSLTSDFQIEHPSASRQHAALVHHENGGLYAIDLKSSHGTAVNGKRLKPYEATRLRDGVEVLFGASSRSYRVSGLEPPRRVDEDGDDLDEDEQGPSRKREAPAGMHPKKWQKKTRRWLAGPKTGRKMSENERVAMGAGSGSGCMGPGFDN